MNYRRDKRSLTEFKQDIKMAHDIQAWLMESWTKGMSEAGYLISLKDKGTDNSGAYVSKASNEPDYEVEIMDKIHKQRTSFLLEVKTCPHYKYMNFKVDSLEAIVQHKAFTLVFVGVNTKARSKQELLEGLNESSWCLFGHEVALRMLQEKKPRIIPAINGGKPSIGIDKKEYNQYFRLVPFGKSIRE